MNICNAPSRVQRNRARIQKSKKTSRPLRPVGNGLDRSGALPLCCPLIDRLCFMDHFYFPAQAAEPLLFRSAGKGGKGGLPIRPAAALVCKYTSLMCSANHPKNSATHVASNILGVCFSPCRRKVPSRARRRCAEPAAAGLLVESSSEQRLKAPGGFSRGL